MTTAANPSVGLVGWRGMVGSVLMQRMQDENDFANINPVFFSTSNAGGAAPSFADGAGKLEDAFDIETLAKLPIIVTAGAATTPSRFTANSATAAGMASGSMLPPHCA